MGDEIRFTDTTTDLSKDGSEKLSGKVGEKAWYVVNTYSTHEKKVAGNLERRIESMGLSELIFRVVVAEVSSPVMDKETNLQKVDKEGKAMFKMKNLYPGYVFVEMIMTDYAWYVVRNTPGVTGFVGSSGKGTKPFPIPREQVEPVLKRMGMVDEAMYDRYNEGDYVRVIHGALEGTEGTIKSIDRENGVVELETIFFGRATKAEVDFSEIEKAN